MKKTIIVMLVLSAVLAAPCLADISADVNLLKKATHLIRARDHAGLKSLVSANPKAVTVTDPKKGNSALHYAAFMSRPVAAAILIERGAEVNLPNKQGYTPLIYAAWWGDAKTTALLIDSNADPTAKTEDGMTALHFAAKSGKAGNVSVLLKVCADVNVRDKKGRTALKVAKRNGYMKIVEMIRSSGGVD